ncbi:MAG: glycolate oxidase subunit GlcF [Alphaproteobacteria bacterium]|nr:glycolate oxidase subunit GlcF [Alphaproteobacteria bacterium]
MQTSFTSAQLRDPDIAEADRILRACVHCGFCTATCPTYTLLGDERDSPRGRIYLIKDMLEKDRPAGATEALHLDRCLSCLSCMTTCPSGVHYMHLVDMARTHVAETFRRPLMDRLVRRMLLLVLPYPARFRAALVLGRLARPFAPLLPGRLAAMLRLAPRRIAPPSPLDLPQTFPAEGTRRMRVALLAGCAQQVLNPAINESSIRLLTRHGCEVVLAPGAGCCGALAHHMGEEEAALTQVKANIEAWSAIEQAGPLDAIVINASGCGTMVKDYGFMLREDAEWGARAARIAALARDVSEVMERLGLHEPGGVPRLKVAYHSACSLQHGQRIEQPPRTLLAAAGFEVREIAEGHLCCGSAGTYNLLQPELAARLQQRKAENIAATGADLVAAGNIGCMVQIAGSIDRPVVHTVELLDWATGGPKPQALEEGA